MYWNLLTPEQRADVMRMLKEAGIRVGDKRTEKGTGYTGLVGFRRKPLRIGVENVYKRSERVRKPYITPEQLIDLIPKLKEAGIKIVENKAGEGTGYTGLVGSRQEPLRIGVDNFYKRSDRVQKPLLTPEQRSVLIRKLEEAGFKVVENKTGIRDSFNGIVGYRTKPLIINFSSRDLEIYMRSTYNKY